MGMMHMLNILLVKVDRAKMASPPPYKSFFYNIVSKSLINVEKQHPFKEISLHKKSVH